MCFCVCYPCIVPRYLSQNYISQLEKKKMIFMIWIPRRPVPAVWPAAECGVWQPCVWPGETAVGPRPEGQGQHVPVCCIAVGLHGLTDQSICHINLTYTGNDSDSLSLMLVLRSATLMAYQLNPYNNESLIVLTSHRDIEPDAILLN